jgi:hypothetical protein
MNLYEVTFEYIAGKELETQTAYVMATDFNEAAKKVEDHHKGTYESARTIGVKFLTDSIIQ